MVQGQTEREARPPGGLTARPSSAGGLRRRSDATEERRCEVIDEELKAILVCPACKGYLIEAEPLGTGGGIRNAADLASGTVWVLNGDVLTDADLSAMRAFHEARGSRATIFLYPVRDPRPYGLVETASDGRLERFREKPAADERVTTNTINAGVYLLDAALLALIPSRRVVSIEREFFPALIADGVPCYGWTAAGDWP